MSQFKKRFHSLYWRQLMVTAGMVLLTLALLGAAFFSLSYNYAREQKTEELRGKAQVVSQMASSYLERRPDHQQEDLRELATFAATVSDVDFLICDLEGHVHLSTDADMEGLVVTMPKEIVKTVQENGTSSQWSTLSGLYESRRLVVGVPAYSPDGDVRGMAFAISTSDALFSMWHGFAGLFFMTAFVVLLISFAAVIRLTKPVEYKR